MKIGQIVPEDHPNPSSWRRAVVEVSEPGQLQSIEVLVEKMDYTQRRYRLTPTLCEQLEVLLRRAREHLEELKATSSWKKET